MLDTQQEYRPETEVEKNSVQNNEGLNKYTKRIDDLIEDAEIEAEIEAARKIRSKNSRQVSISLVGIVLLGFIYFQIQNQSTPSEPLPGTPLAGQEKDEFSEQVPVFEEARIPSGLPAMPQTEPFSAGKPVPAAQTSKPPVTTKASAPKSPQSFAARTKKPADTSFANQNVRKVSLSGTSQSSASTSYFIQLGAFSVRANAGTLQKRVNAKGYKAAIEPRPTKTRRFVVTLGNFSNRQAGKNKSLELEKKGFAPSIGKNKNGTYAVILGKFRTQKRADLLLSKLKANGYSAQVEKMIVDAKTYVVQLGPFSSQEKARKTQLDLVNKGIKNSFIR